MQLFWPDAMYSGTVGHMCWKNRRCKLGRCFLFGDSDFHNLIGQDVKAASFEIQLEDDDIVVERRRGERTEI